jgi:hypothetical protein
MNTKTILGVLVLSTLFLVACEKGPGEGGTSAIRGKVIMHEFNKDFGEVTDVYPAQKEDVYIIYGNDDIYGDNMETNYNGVYEFNYLQEGKYIIFVYSKDSTLSNNKSKDIAVIVEVEITGKNQTIEVPDIIIASEVLPGKGGTSIIRGKVIIREYNKDFTILRDIYPAQKEDVYIIYGDEEVYSESFKTNYNGFYEFGNLREGIYKIFAYSKDSTLNYDVTSQEKAVIKEVEITSKNQTIEVPDIYILK